MSTSEIATVLAWHDALNDRDIDTLVKLSSDDIDQIWSCHCETMRHYGFDRLLYGFVPFRTQLRKFDESDALILNSHGPLYVDRLNSNKFLGFPLGRSIPRRRNRHRKISLIRAGPHISVQMGALFQKRQKLPSLRLIYNNH